MNPIAGDDKNKALLKSALLALDELQAKVDSMQRARQMPIAIVGMGCRFPGGANSPDAYWQLLLNGVDAVRELPPDRWQKEDATDPHQSADLPVAWYGGFLDDIDQFDPLFFGISPREAVSMDPQQRLVLEVGWEALESAGQSPDRLVGSQTGVFLGITTNDYGSLLRQGGAALMDAYAATGGALNAAAGRLAFTLGLQGPTLAVDTACSSSLVAVHLACQSLRSGECSMALAGGVNATLTADAFISFARWGMMAPDGRCKTFDASANGFVRGEGCGMVVLKRLDDALAAGDRILALVRGSAVNQDGRSSGLTVPNGLAQQAVIRRALADARVRGGQISYVEAHGTGTALGDPIEVEALGAVLGEGRPADRPLVIGSVKTNLGHLESAAGVAGLIKLVLSLQHATIPPQLHFQQRNPRIPWPAFAVEIPTQPMPWLRTEGTRLAGISGFGFSGTNAHLVIEEAPAAEVSQGPVPGETERPVHIAVLSAPNSVGLAALADRHAQHLEAHPELVLPDVAHTLNTGRGQFAQRLAVVAASTQEMQTQLRSFASGQSGEGLYSGMAGAGSGRSVRPRIAFLFTGQGSQYAGMGQELYATQATFRQALDQCAALFDLYLDRPLLSVLFGAPGAAGLIDETTYTQPALFAFEYALAQLWGAWGVRPSVVVGHSIGEYTAACLANVFSLEDAVRLVSARGRLMGALLRDGEMLALEADEAQARLALLPYAAEVSVAAVNGPRSVVIAGQRAAVLAIRDQMTAAGVRTQRLNVSHAFHSPLMEPMLEEFATVAASVRYRRPELRLVANVTGKLAGEEVTRPEYWVRHVREAVRFADGVTTLHEQGVAVLVEVGPKPVLLGLAGQVAAGDGGGPAMVSSLRQGRGEWRQMLGGLGELYVSGVEVDWAGFDRDYRRRKVPLPTYPFQRQRYWLEAPKGKHLTAPIRPLIDRVTTLPLHDETVYEADFSVEALPFLADHRVHDTIIAPGACQLAMALNAAELALGRHEWLRLEDVVLPQALVVPAVPAARARTVQAVFSAAQALDGAADEPAGRASNIDQGNRARRKFNIVSFLVRSGGAGDDTVGAVDGPRGFDLATHATGYAAASRDNWPAVVDFVVDLQALQQRCNQVVDVNTFYADSAAAQIELGPAFRWLTDAWRGQDSAAPEALARLARPAGVVGTEGYVLHPGLLDACFQVTGLAEEANQETLLPFAVESLAVRHNVACSDWWCHAVRTARHQWDIRLFGQDGETIVAIRGFQVRAAAAAAVRGHEAWRKWLYASDWLPRPYFGLLPDYLRDPAVIVGEIAAYVGKDAAGRDENRGAFLRALERLSTAWVLACFDKAGFRWQAGTLWRSDQIARQIGVIPTYTRLLERLLEILEESGVVLRTSAGWRVVQVPEAVDPAAILTSLEAESGEAPELRLLARCGGRLGEVLRGVQEPRELLDPGGDGADTAELLGAGRGGQLVQDMLRRILAHLPAGRGLRILEVNAGAGGAAAWVLPLLPASRVEYIFTDGSATVLQNAQARLAAYPFVRCQALDIEQSPTDQRFAQPLVDLVLAANVLHATRDLGETLTHVRQLLQPGGQLVLLETTTHESWLDLTFGLEDDWWRFADDRKGHPLLIAEAWKSLLLGHGFGAVEVIEQGGQAVILARAADGSAASIAAPGGSSADETPTGTHHVAPLAAGGGYVVMADAGGIGAELAELLRRQGVRVVVAYAGEAWDELGADTVCLAPSCDEDYRRLVRLVPEVHGVVYLWSIGSAAGGGVGEELDDLVEAGRGGCESALRLVQALAAEQITPAGLWLVTQDTQAAAVGDTVCGVAQAGLWGLGKVIGLEHPELHPVCVDLGRTGGVAVHAAQLQAELTTGGSEREQVEQQVALRPDGRYVARLVRYAEETVLAVPAAPYRLEVRERGLLENVELQPVERRAPGRGEVEIAVAASGLNFRDMLNVLGAYPGDPGPIGSECAGEVVAVGEGVTQLAVGDRVLAMTAGAISEYVTVNSAYVAPIGAGLSVVEAAGLPTAYLTAYYGLHELAGMKAGARVLIHAAAGGVGLAAVQLAQAAGAEVYATASAGKWETLRAYGVRHIYNSRTVEFAGQILADTHGRGVDIILNSLTGPGFMEANLAVLGAGGYLAEMSKRNIWSDEQVAAVRADVGYKVFDLGETSLAQPELWQAMLGKVMALLAAGKVTALPCTVYPLQEAVAALRTMQQARHVGKVVLVAPSWRCGEETGVRIRGDGTYLVTGGLGGLGLAVAGWLAEQGARHLLLVGRREPQADAQAALAALRAQGVEVKVAQADVADYEQLKAVMQAGAARQRLCGVVHAAGVLDDGALQQQSWERFARVLGPKVQGAWNLHRLTQGMRLDFFVLFSSGAGVLGNRGQANYAAANAFLDGFAHYRRSAGLPALSIDWGAWAEIGMAAELVRRQRGQLAVQGMEAIAPAQGIAVLAHLLGRTAPQVAVLPILWQKLQAADPAAVHSALLANFVSYTDGTNTVPNQLTRAALAVVPDQDRGVMLCTYLAQQAAQVLRVPVAELNTGEPLTYLGLDSLMALELRNRIVADLQVNLPVTLLLEGLSVSELQRQLMERLDATQDAGRELQSLSPAAALAVATDRDAAVMLAQLDEMSEENVDLLLEKLLAEEGLS